MTDTTATPAVDHRPTTGPGRAPVEPDAAAVRRSRRRLLVILACFAVPLLAATIWVQVLRMNGGTIGDTSRGQLVLPTRAIEPFELGIVAGVGAGDGTDGGLGTAWGLDDMRGLWTLMYVVEGECDESCERNLYNMRQVRLALNQRKDRVHRVAVVQGPDQIPADLLAEHRGLVVVGDGTAGGAGDGRGAREGLVGQIRTAEVDGQGADGTDAGGAAPLDGIWLLDPNGNLVLRFAPDLDPSNMLKDVKHLLKVSRIG